MSRRLALPEVICLVSDKSGAKVVVLGPHRASVVVTIVCMLGSE